MDISTSASTTFKFIDMKASGVSIFNVNGIGELAMGGITLDTSGIIVTDGGASITESTNEDTVQVSATQTSFTNDILQLSSTKAAATTFNAIHMKAGGSGTTIFEVLGDGSIVTTASTASTSPTTGSIKTAGGMGIGGAIYAGGVIVTTDTTDSTSVTTGSMIVAGGMGVAGRVSSTSLDVLNSESLTSTTATAYIRNTNIGFQGNMLLIESAMPAGSADFNLIQAKIDSEDTPSIMFEVDGTGFMTAAGGMHVESGGLLVSAGGGSIVAGGLKIAAGGMSLTSTSAQSISHTGSDSAGLTIQSGGGLTFAGGVVFGEGGCNCATSGSLDLKNRYPLRFDGAVEDDYWLTIDVGDGPTLASRTINFPVDEDGTILTTASTGASSLTSLGVLTGLSVLGTTALSSTTAVTTVGNSLTSGFVGNLLQLDSSMTTASTDYNILLARSDVSGTPVTQFKIAGTGAVTAGGGLVVESGGIDVQAGDLTFSNTGAQSITHTGATNAHLTISSQNGAIVIDDLTTVGTSSSGLIVKGGLSPIKLDGTTEGEKYITFALAGDPQGDFTLTVPVDAHATLVTSQSTLAQTIQSDVSVSVEGIKFVGTDIMQGAGTGSLTIEDVTIQDRAMSTISSLGMDGHLTNSAGNILMTSTDAQKITHVGTASDSKDLEISSTNGAVKVEDLLFTGGALSSTGPVTFTSSSSTVSIEGSKFTDNAIDQHDASGALVVEGVTIQDQAMSTITSLGMSGDLTNSAGNILMTSTSAQAITHTGTNSGSKDLMISSTNGAVKVEDLLFTSGDVTSSSAITLTSTGSTIQVEDFLFTGPDITRAGGSGALSLEDVSFEDGAMDSITSLTMSGDLTNSGGDILMTSSSAQAITHTGGATAHLSISSTAGSVVVESVSFAGAVLTSSAAITVDSDASVSVENVKFDANAMSHKDDGSNALVFEGVTFVNTAMSDISTISMTSDLTIANTNSDILMTSTSAQAITHTGAATAHLSISSTVGSVVVESWKFTGGAVTSSSDLSITSTGSTVSIEGTKFTSDNIDQSSADGPLVVEGVSLQDNAITTSGAITASGNIYTSKANGGLILSATGAQVITHTGASDADLTISSTYGKVCVESICTQGGAVTSSAAITIDASDASHSVSVEDFSFKANAVNSLAGNTYLSVEDVRFQDGDVTEVRSIAIDPNSASGGAVVITNTQTQTSGSLVKITGQAGEKALEVVAGETNFGDKFKHKAAGVTDFVTEVGTVSVDYDDTAVMSASMDTMSGIYTINSVNTAAGSCSTHTVSLQTNKITGDSTLVLLEVAAYVVGTGGTGGTMFTNGVPFIIQNAVSTGAVSFNVCNSGDHALSGNLKVSWLVLGG
eukprot:g3806.t1